MHIFEVKMKVLNLLFEKVAGVAPESVVKLSGDGSNRAYYRMRAGDVSLIGVVGTCVEENKAFVAVSDQFVACGLNAPRVLAVSDDALCYVQEDLGNMSLFAFMKESRDAGTFSQKDVDVLCRVMSELPDIQYRVAEGFDFSVCYPVAEFERRTIMWDLNYFKYCFLKGVGVEFDENLLEDEFEKLTQVLLSCGDNVFMYRDFQSRNVMIRDGKPWLIDFQGGRRGPIEYDLASFLWQARARFTPTLRRELISEYLRSAQRYRSFDEEVFYQRLQYFVLFRTLQVLGAYGYRGYFEHKAHFVQSIPMAIENLRSLLAENTFTDLPYLTAMLQEMIDLPLFDFHQEETELTVRITSFSYKKGIPDDNSGNGGGFVFDCRAIHNPGRYAEYKQFTGTDEPVITFLDKEEAMQEFLNHVYGIVDYTVEKYLSRGFTSLMVSFGCTGGQHRSVYSAEHLAAHLSEKYGIRILLEHREQKKRLTIT